MMPFDSSLPDFMMEPSSDSGFYEGYSLDDDFSRGNLTEVAGSIIEGRETTMNAPILTQHHLQTPGAQTNITQNQQVHASSEDPFSSSSLHNFFDPDQNQYLQLQQDPIFSDYQDQEHNTDEEKTAPHSEEA
ncbi:uncharacterized protein EAE97_008985 [Botrytis byssoidea]|uniref:Uncharacterized protein n=1 Tax=Botrytis byssoidea TaxID=139641 RepID=A0A9P5I7M1_9HELO|nr:uncharacterized protein EAE97_008985 [Botrytis byssoidea]KAF7931964.1 hypothetical protein EAE97_008985 [Botrytis byssoidea]